MPALRRTRRTRGRGDDVVKRGIRRRGRSANEPFN
jgi:hypothetical protein